MLKIIVFILCIFGTFTSFAQQSVLLNQYRSMALAYSHDLKTAEKNLEVSIELEKMARADKKPKLSANANFQYIGNPMEIGFDIPSLGAPLSLQANNLQYGASVSLFQPIYTGGRILESLKMAKNQQSLAKNQAELIRSSVCFQLDIQYWNTVARYRMVDIAGDFRNSIASLVKIIKERVEVGAVDPQDLLMAEVKLNEAEYALLQAKNNFETGRMALNAIIGVNLDTKTEIEEDIPIIVVQDSLFRTESENRPEIKMAEDAIKIAENTLRLKDAQYKPQFYVGAEGSYSSPGYNFNADLDPNYALYAKLSVPIFEWGKRRSQKRASSLQIGMANDKLNRTLDNVNLDIQTSRAALLQALQRIGLAESSLGKAEENERKALERYKEGEISILEVIDAQTYRQNSQINYTQAKGAAQGYYTELLKALNAYDFQ